ncbi:MAG: 50S ribosomal protein L24 [Phoenicibacter congonensis]|jgi:large subunit ribosomal protein L24|uniref:Large ribosomal subunit protein uL24 n=1 Tax=Phoenicibacter congonensis TaxID=1944646 RepID=A0AA43RI43_9ACTN|nr:50S ribosomal protein L24 [Phoenicibacter congonensis]
MAVKFGKNARGKVAKFKTLPIKSDDQVEVLAGKDKGKKGKVLRVIPAQNKVVVEGINTVRKTMRPTQANPQGGISTVEAPLNVSNVSLVCPSCGEKTRAARRRDEKGKKIRVCKKCGADIDK